MPAKYDVAIIGGGPAGLATAIAVTKRGFRAVVLEARDLPVDKACGEGLLPDAIERLGRFGISVALDDRGSFRGIQFSDDQTTVFGRFPAGEGWGVRRTTLHALLAQRAEELGVDLLWRTPVSEINGHQVICRRWKLEARWIVGADGLHSQVQRWSGLDRYVRNCERVAFRQHFAVKPRSDFVQVLWNEAGQCYITPIGKGEISVALICREGHMPFEQMLRSFPSIGEYVATARASSSMRGCLTASRRLRQIHREHVALIGDASGSVDAITGEGICLAIKQAEALAEALVAQDFRIYTRRHAAILRRPRVMAAVLSAMSKHTRLRSRVLRGLGRDPGFFEKILAFHLGEISFHQLGIGAPLKMGGRLLGAR